MSFACVGGVAERAVTSGRTYRTALCLAFFCVAFFQVSFHRAYAEAPSSHRFGLLIANGNYPDAGGTAPTSGKDADLLATELTQDGFEIDLRKDLSRFDTKKAIDAFVDKLTPNAEALFYFNGIGIQVARQTFLIPVNAQIWSENDVKREGINLDALLGDIDRKGARVKIVIIDAARRNPFERRFRANATGLASLDVPTGTLAIFSDALGKIGKEATGDVSPFMSRLIGEMQTADIGAEVVFTRVRIAVSNLAGRDHVPWGASTLTTPFIFKKTEADAQRADVTRRNDTTKIFREMDTAKAITGETSEAAPRRLDVDPADPARRERTVGDPCDATITESSGVVTLAIQDRARAGKTTTFTLDNRVFGALFDGGGRLQTQAPMFHATADLDWTGTGGKSCHRTGIAFENFGALVQTALIWTGPYVLGLHVVEPPDGRLGGPANYVFSGRPNVDHGTGLGDLKTFGRPDEGTTQIQLYTLPSDRNPHRGDVYYFVEFASRGDPARMPFCGDATEAIARFKILHLDSGVVEQKGGSFGSVACGTSWPDTQKEAGYLQRWKWKL